MTTSEINEAILSLDATSDVSDGHHTFGELYDFRNLLFVIILQTHPLASWRAAKNADGSLWDGWFVAGINRAPGEQITFHLPLRLWHSLDMIETHDVNPYFDGHTSSDVLDRLKSLCIRPEVI
jgi:hypothetical protein